MEAPVDSSCEFEFGVVMEVVVVPFGFDSSELLVIAVELKAGFELDIVCPELSSSIIQSIISTHTVNDSLIANMYTSQYNMV